MKLYYAETLNPRKACAVARYLDSPVQFVPVDLGRGEHKTPDYLAINPNGVVPALEDGETVLWEANAIMCHLAVRASSKLWPAPRLQPEVIRWLSWDTNYFSRFGGTLYFLRLIAPHLGMGEPPPQAIDQALAGFRQYAAILNSHLVGRRHVVGDGLTVADFALASALPYARAAHIPLGEFPEICRWYARLEELEAWREPFPKRAAA